MVKVALAWQVNPQTSSDLGDTKVFVHLLGQHDKIVVQADQRPGEGTLPPANWLPGIRQDTFRLVIPADTLPGTYRVAIGLYDPVTSTRLSVSGIGSDTDNRVFIGTIAYRLNF